MRTEEKRSTGFGSPFDLYDEDAYQRWRSIKLKSYPSCADDLVIKINDPTRLSLSEKQALLARCSKANLVIYEVAGSRRVDKHAIRALGRQLGLQRLDSNLCADNDSITSLQVRAEGRKSHYIPYTDRPLSWHTDGYYNESANCIQSILMHCVEQAFEGGENRLLDHEIAYLMMRDENPDYIYAFMRDDAMSIPANSENGIELRPLRSGPVFYVDIESGHLMMRYTARSRNILWRQDKLTQRAVKFMHDLLIEETPYLFRYRLEPGQGILCNNVLHNRNGFSDGGSDGRRRLYYRARYYDRIGDGCP